MSIDVRPDARPITGQRSVGIDVVRVVGVVAIVAGHTWNEQWAREWLFSWHVPVFFVITGYLWNRERTVRSEVVKRARSLLVPYACWLLLIAAAWYGWLLANNHSFGPQSLVNLLLGGAHIQRPFSAFWFITALFIATVLMRWLDGVSRFLPWFVGACGLAWCLLEPEIASDLPWSAGIAVAAVFFIAIGRTLRSFRSSIERPAAFGLALLVPSAVLVAVTDVGTLNLKAGEVGTPLLSIALAAAVSCGLLLLAEAIAPRLPGFVARSVTVVASASLPIIFSHALVLGVSAAIGIEPSKWVFLVAYLAPLALALLIRKTPLARWLM